jgi:alpha,alpha-trehalose-phosphate synthase [UDP-forming]/trehalose-phosphatase
MKDSYDGHTLILLSNREPYEHVKSDGEITVRYPPGGLVSALDPTMRRTNGIWVAWGSGSADRETADERGRLRVPPEDPAYTLRRVWLDDSDIDGYYLGFANSTLWPVCHMLLQHFEFREEHWERYQSVNSRFAQAVLEEVQEAPHAPMVWIQDYHFALVAEELREHRPRLLIHQFWHIPFPPPDVLRLIPVGVHDALIRGMLGNDLIGFHTARYAQNFLDCVERSIKEADVDHENMTVYYRGRRITMGIFPIGIDFDHYERLALDPMATQLATWLRERYTRDGRQLAVSVDRMDYTKGIPERLRALEHLWTEHPSLRRKLTMIIVATPSRTDIPAYQILESEVINRVADINAQFGDDDWTPIVLIHENITAERLASVYRAADLCLVSSLQDGMNLVSKEFVACQIEERGVLVLSRFTGVADEIDGAVLVNPFNIDGFVAGIRTALEMPLEERRERMQRMREQFRGADVWKWLDSILTRAHELWLLRGADRKPIPITNVSEQLRTRLTGAPFVVMLDIDGTLAPIVPRPEDVAIPVETREILNRLSRCANVHVVLVSGRAANDAARIVGIHNIWISGNHGIELLTPQGQLQIDERAAASHSAVVEVAEVLEKELDGFPDVQLENKEWTLSIHYRRADPLIVPALRALVQRVAHERGLRVTEGKSVLEIRPTAPIDKGSAVMHLAEQLGAHAFGASVLFAGDDTTDEDAFRALRSRIPQAVTVRVTEDAEAETAAEFVVPDIEQMRTLLEQLCLLRLPS